MDANTDSLRREIYASMDMKDTQELLAIWAENDREAWSEQAFDVIQDILRKRNAEIPAQPGEAKKELARKSTVKKVKQQDYSEIGGWLYLVGIGIVLNPLFLLASIGRMILGLLEGRWISFVVPGTSVYHPLWALVIPYQFFGGIALLILSIVVAVLFLKKHRALPITFIAWLLLNLVYNLVLYFLIGLVSGPAGQSYEPTIIRNVIICLIWIPYFLLSKRVKGTFIHGQERVPKPGPDLSDSTHWVV